MAKRNDPYVNVTRNWATKMMGPKITREQFNAAHALTGLNRAFGKQSLARALELRPDGATDGQIKAACISVWGSSGSHHNKRGDLHRAKLITVSKVKPEGGGHTVYRIACTPKGEALVAGNPVKAPAKPKPHATKAAVEAITQAVIASVEAADGGTYNADDAAADAVVTE